jgi:hypothetical protein
MGDDVSFEEDLAAAKEAPTRHVDVKLEVNGNKHTFRFRRMDGTEYARETFNHPPDPTVPFDRLYGYNVNSLAVAVAPRCAVRLDGDTEVTLSREQWDDLFAVLDGGATQEIASTIYSLNEYASAKGVQAARKALNGSLRSSS